MSYFRIVTPQPRAKERLVWRRLLLSLYLLFLLFSACAPQRAAVPPGVVPEPKPLNSEDEQYGHQILSELSQRYKLDYDHPRGPNVRKVVERLTAAAHADQDPWHVVVFKDDSFKNAAATRGNHVFIWTGMLDATQSDDELAAILGHEISHVLARHTDPDPNEQVKQIMIGVGAMVAGIAAGRATGNPSLARTASDLASSLTQKVGEGMLVYPYSREREAEADQIGLFMMADAHYDPRGAIEFWTRVQNNPEFTTSFAFLSSHPPADERLAILKRLLPQALERYEGTSSAAPQVLAGGNAISRKVVLSGAGGRNRSGTAPALPNSPSVPVADSFDIREAPGGAITMPSAGGRILTHQALEETRLVVSEIAIVYERPSLRSKPLGEFRRGARISVVPAKSGWMEVFAPDHGFLEQRNLTAASGPGSFSLQ